MKSDGWITDSEINVSSGAVPKKMMHLLSFVQHGVINHAQLMWAHPRDKVGYDFARPPYWQELGRILERGKFDALFLADVLAPYDVYKDSYDDTVRYAVQCPVHDPVALVPVIGCATEKLGIGITISTTFDTPYAMARRLSTLDHLTEGRLGWNVVTSYSQNEFKAMGMKEMVPHDERYERAEEFIEVCRQLWDSWEDDAIVADAETGIYADPAKVHRVVYQGKYYNCASPSFVRPSPQRRPVIWQAGQSPRGRDYAAKHAEAVFSIQPTAKAMRSYADDLRARAVAQGRQPQDVKIIFALQVVVDETREAALEKLAKMRAKIPVDAALAIMSGHIGYDFSKLALDEHVGQIEVEGIRGLLESVLSTYDGAPVTLREAANFYGISLGAPVAVGDPTDVADLMEELLDEGHGDGFNIMATYVPGCYQEFVDLVVPQLQKRGRFRKEYTGSTLRHHLNEY
jgi:FMN-dependent oxidoreductase (nitrilotriacetate monooxygenase family)